MRPTNRRFLRFALVAAVVLIGVAVAAIVRTEKTIDAPPDSTAGVSPSALGPDAELLALEAEAPAEPLVGLWDGSESVFRGGAGPYENMWGAFENGIASQAYAGWNESDPSQGVITTISWRWSGSVDVTKAKEWPAPDGVGALRITKVVGDILRFASKNGRSGTFDLVTHRYELD